MAYEITSGDNLITVRIFDTVDDEQMLMMRDELYSHDQHATAHQLIDFSGVTHFDISPIGAKNYAESSKSRSELKQVSKDRRMAGYATTDLGFGMCRLMAARAAAVGFEILVFRDFSQALNYLKTGNSEGKIEESLDSNAESLHSKLTK